MHNTSQIRNTVLSTILDNITSKHINLIADQIKDDMRFKEDLHIDSLDKIHIAYELEQIYGIEINHVDYLDTVRDLCDHVYTLIKKRNVAA